MSGLIINSFISFGGEEDLAMPAGVPDPLIWYTARHVELSGDEITKYLNQGDGGSTYDATPINSSFRAALSNINGHTASEMDHNGTTSGGYSFTSISTAKTCMFRVTYNGGADTTFETFDTFLEGGTFKIVGNSGLASLFSGQPSDAILNGSRVGNAATVLALDNETLGGVSASALGCNTFMNNTSFQARVPRAVIGDFMIWDEQLTDTQISDMHDEMDTFYA